MMTLNRRYSLLAVGLLGLLSVSPALAQTLPDFQLFAPAEVRPYGGGAQPNEGYFFVFNGMEWVISTPDVTAIGNPMDDTPLVFSLGNDTTGWTLTNNQSTSPFRWKSVEGKRVDLGFVEGHNGWLFSGYQLNNQQQNFTATDVHMVFDDSPAWRFPPLGDYPPGSGNPRGGRLVGPVIEEEVAGGDDDDDDDDDDLATLVNLPVFFDQVRVTNRVEHWSLEVMCLHRLHPFHNGGVIELFGGVRYMEFDDLFTVDAKAIPGGGAGDDDDDDDDTTGDDDDDDDTTTGDDDDDDTTEEEVELGVEDRQRVILANSDWGNNAHNRIVGPQVGVRWFRKRGRWTLSSEGRFFAGFNSQSIRQSGTLGSELEPLLEERGAGEPDLMLATNFNHVERISEWSPAVELRAEVVYQLTKAVSFRTGWTGIWMDGIARGANMVDYSLRENSVMGILADQNDQDVFMHAWTIGFDVCR